VSLDIGILKNVFRILHAGCHSQKERPQFPPKRFEFCCELVGSHIVINNPMNMIIKELYAHFPTNKNSRQPSLVGVSNFLPMAF